MQDEVGIDGDGHYGQRAGEYHGNEDKVAVMRFASSSNLYTRRLLKGTDVNHQATCISSQIKQQRYAYTCASNGIQASPSTIKQLLQQSKPCHQGYIHQ